MLHCSLYCRHMAQNRQRKRLDLTCQPFPRGQREQISDIRADLKQLHTYGACEHCAVTRRTTGVCAASGKGWIGRCPSPCAWHGAIRHTSQPCTGEQNWDLPLRLRRIPAPWVKQGQPAKLSFPKYFKVQQSLFDYNEVHSALKLSRCASLKNPVEN